MPENVTRIRERLSMSLLDPDKLVKVNDLQEVTNPVFFIKNSFPTSDGLLSNEIFGITKDERANTFAYIDLDEYFIHPLIYKIWCKLDSKIRECVHGTKKFIINSRGQLEENEDGEYGVSFLKKNINNIIVSRTTSSKRDMNVDFFEKNKKDSAVFIRKCIVIPAYYRDVNIDKGHIAVGGINELYRILIIAVRSLKESSDYGLTLSPATRGRIQEILLQIYNYFGQGTTVGSYETPNLIPGKTGLIRRSVTSKTTDYSSRLVLSAPNIKAEKLEDLEVNMDYSAVPLASICTNFYPFMIFYIRRWFELLFSGDAVMPSLNKKGELLYFHAKDYQVEFSDDRIKKEIDRFLTGYSNRLIPIRIPTIEGDIIRLRFKGYNMTPEEYAKGEPGKFPIMERDITWCDIFYRAAVESVKDRHIMITRYPIDSYTNQFPTKIKVSSTVETEPMIVDDEFYPKYPKIRQQDIESNTSNKFVDTLNMSNLWLDATGADYKLIFVIFILYCHCNLR